MFCLEMVIIEAALLVFMCLELYKISKYILSKQYAKVTPSQIGNQYKVMAGVADEPGNGMLIQETEETLLLQKLI